MKGSLFTEFMAVLTNNYRNFYI